MPAHAPTSWDELCTYDGATYATAAEAAEARGLSSNGKLAELSMREDVHDRLSSGSRLRSYLVSLLTSLDECGNLLDLVEEFLPQLGDRLELGADDNIMTAVLRMRSRPQRPHRCDPCTRS